MNCLERIERIVHPEAFRDRFIGALLGTFVGDALGMPVEGWSTGDIRAELGEVRDMLPARMGAGTYTDDTQMMIGLAETLAELGRLDPEAAAKRFVENFDSQRGYSHATIRCLSRIAVGEPWDQVYTRALPGGSFGNGAAMRIAPLGIFYYDDVPALRQASYDACRITHKHPLGIAGGTLQAFAVALAVQAAEPAKLDPLLFLQCLEDFLDPAGEPLKEKLHSIPILLENNPPPEVIVATLGNNSFIHNSVPAALYSFLAHRGDFTEAVVAAVGLGGDTDTIGAMTGALAGAAHGYHALPAAWLEKLENGEKGRDYVIQLGETLWRKKFMR